MIAALLSILIGIPFGILSSLIAWWILFYIFVPKVQFSNFISKVRTDETKCGFKYRIAFHNSGRRNVIDAEVYVKLRIIGLKPEYPNNSNVFALPLGYNHIPKIRPEKRGIKHIIRLDVIKIDELTNSTFPDHIRQNFEENHKLLEDLMALGTDTTLQIFIFGYDEFSGTRKVFESKLYKASDIVCGRFARKSLQVIEYKDGS